MSLRTHSAAIIVAVLLFARLPAQAAEPREIVHLLDYIAQDYSAAVADGKVINAEEFAEMREFSASAQRLGSELPQLAGDREIGRALRELTSLVAHRASPTEVARQARQIKEQVIERTHLATAPGRWPSLEAGGALYQQACAACHGTAGYGDGPVAGALEPKPTNFHDAARMQALAPFQTFNTIRLGVAGTAMPSFGSLRDDETWALAFYVISLRYREAGAEPPRGAPLELAIAASESDRQLETRLVGKPRGTLASTRLQSASLDPGQSLALAITLLREAEAAYRRGDVTSARTKALTAYLDGVEPAEARIRVVAPHLAVEVERQMSNVRAAIEHKQTAARLTKAVTAATNTIHEVEQRLQGGPTSPWLVFSVAAAIVLREGFEAILIIVSILSVLRAVGARHATKWVHTGWGAALAVGVLAWLASDRLLRSSGWSREVLEAATSLVAVVVLLYLGIWLHRRTQIGRWKAFIEDQVTSALSSRKLFGLTVISFLAVFREAIETVLFLVALSMEGGSAGRQMMAAGVVVSIGCTILLAWALVRFSARLPLRTIFGATSVVMIVLAVILGGKGARALQEIGTLPVTQTLFDYRIDLLGFFPTVETLLFQAVVAVLAAILWFREREQSARRAGSA